MSKKVHHKKHSHNISQEVFVGRLFWFGIAAFFLLIVFSKLSSKGLVGMQIFESGGFSFLGSTFLEAWNVYLKPIFVILDVFLAVVLVFAIFKVWGLRPSAHAHGEAHGAGHGGGDHGVPAEPVRNPLILKHWTDIVRRANTGTPENLRWAIMEADALVDKVLKDRQLSGETMADRLANFRREDYKHIDKLWDAHRLRNEIAHTPGFKMNTRQAEKALFAYRDFLKELKAF